MRVVRWTLKGLVIVVIVTLVGVVALVAAMTGRGLPQTSGTIRVPGLHAPASVVRDAAGIIHIRADDPHDLFLAQGYVHAQERMWQMEVWRHISSGRLSELFGEGRVETDRSSGRSAGAWRPSTTSTPCHPMSATPSSGTPTA